MKPRGSRTKRSLAFCVAAAMLLLPAMALADVSLTLDDGAIDFGGDSAAGTTNYSQAANTNVGYTGKATVTGDYNGTGSAITVSGGDHTIVVESVNITPATPDSAEPGIKITGGEQSISLEDTFINAGASGPAMVIDGGEHTIVLDDCTVNGSGGDGTDAGIIVEGGASVTLTVWSDSTVAMGDAPAMAVTEGSDVTVLGTATLALHAEDPVDGALAGDGSGTLNVPAGSGATVEVQALGAATPVQGVELSGFVSIETGPLDQTGQTATTVTVTSPSGGGSGGAFSGGVNYNRLLRILAELNKANEPYGAVFSWENGKLSVKTDMGGRFLLSKEFIDELKGYVRSIQVSGAMLLREAKTLELDDLLDWVEEAKANRMHRMQKDGYTIISTVDGLLLSTR